MGLWMRPRRSQKLIGKWKLNKVGNWKLEVKDESFSASIQLLIFIFVEKPEAGS